MAELREDSLLFSLEALMVRERERMALERAEIERQQALDAAARINAEKQRLEAELAREHQLEQARLLERRRMEEHAAQLDALRLGEVERARKEAEARARSEVVAQHHAHERRMTELRLQAGKARDRVLALGSTTLLALLIPSVLWVYFGRVRPQALELQAQSAHLVSVERGRADQAARLLAQSEHERRKLTHEVDELRSQRAVRPVEEGTKPSASRPLLSKPGASAGKEPKKTGRKCKDDGDPLNPCLH
jgi:colicin import membrane protein